METVLAFSGMLLMGLAGGSVLGVALHMWNTRRVVVDTKPMEQKLAFVLYEREVARQKAMARYQ